MSDEQQFDARARVEDLFAQIRREIRAATSTTAMSLLHKTRTLVGQLVQLADENDGRRNARHDFSQAVSGLSNLLARYEEAGADGAKNRLLRLLDKYHASLIDNAEQ